MFTRTDYMNASRTEGAVAHRKYYAQFVNDRTIEVVVSAIGADAIKKSTDQHMNDIALAKWDRLANSLPIAIKPEVVGDFWTLGNAVCVAKEAAKQWKERQS